MSRKKKGGGSNHEAEGAESEVSLSKRFRRRCRRLPLGEVLEENVERLTLGTAVNRNQSAEKRRRGSGRKGRRRGMEDESVVDPKSND